MKNSPLSLALMAVVSLASASPAQAQNLKPGNYEYTTVSEMMGMKILVAFKQCVTQKGELGSDSN